MFCIAKVNVSSAQTSQSIQINLFASEIKEGSSPSVLVQLHLTTTKVPEVESNISMIPQLVGYFGIINK